MKCCNSCGVLLCNADREKISNDGTSWYSQENIDRLWLQAREEGRFLVCHSTDPNATEYSGDTGIKGGKETACLGYTIWIYLHIKIFEYFSNINGKTAFKSYEKAVGKDIAMFQISMHRAAIDMAMGTTGFTKSGPFRGMLIPQSIEESRDIRWPSGFEKTLEAIEKYWPALYKGITQKVSVPEETC